MRKTIHYGRLWERTTSNSGEIQAGDDDDIADRLAFKLYIYYVDPACVV